MAEKSIPYRDYLHQRLSEDEDYARGYLNAALEDDDPATFLLALREVIQSRGGGMAQVAKSARKGEKSLYKSLSETGNPHLKSIRAIVEALGFHLAIS